MSITQSSAVTDPGLGYRLLAPGEIIQENDQCWDEDDGWTRTLCPGSSVGYGTYRRIQEPEADPGEGCRLLSHGETLQEGDEFRCGIGWVETDRAGQVIDRTKGRFGQCVYRRKIDPGPGYRLLAEDETIAEGDEAYGSLTKRWRVTANPGVKAFRSSLISAYRRKIDSSPMDGYRLLDLDEEIKEGDEVLDTSKGWIPSLRFNKTPRHSALGLKYRRKIEEPKIEAGPGYRLLQKGEVVQAGDEFLSIYQNWKPVEFDIGKRSNIDASYYHRRKVEPKVEEPKIEAGPGYRLLRNGEVILPTDEFYIAPSNCWKTTGNPGLKVGSAGLDCVPAYRRKIVPEAVPGYRFLEPHETIQEGDEVWTDDDPRFIKSALVELTVQQVRDYRVEFSSKTPAEIAYRRKGEEPEVVAGPGYRLLQKGDVIQAGDEYWLEGKGPWIAYGDGEDEDGSIGMEWTPFEDGGLYPVRRKLEEPTPQTVAGPGYRLLEDGEEILAGDEYADGSGEWFPTQFAGRTVGWDRGTSGGALVYRRKLVGVVAPEIASAQVTPEPGKAFPRLMRFVGTEDYRNGKGLWVVLAQNTKQGVTVYDRDPYPSDSGMKPGTAASPCDFTNTQLWVPFEGTVILKNR
jgi:hypothetical protein